MKKVLIDTNIILRFLIGDVPKQLTQAKKLFTQIENSQTVGLVSLLVVNELIWILEYFYNQSRKEYLPLVLKLFSLKNLRIVEIKKSDLMNILNKMTETKLDFTDIYLWYLGKDKRINLATFDKKLLKF